MWVGRIGRREMAGGALLVGIVVVLASLRSSIGEAETVRWSRDRLFICSETGKSFRHQVLEGDKYPIISPFSGQRTGYPAELCYWTADGAIADEPTPVLLNTWLGRKEPTFCPDCSRRVLDRNPRPQAGAKPPPRQSNLQGGTYAGQ